MKQWLTTLCLVVCAPFAAQAQDPFAVAVTESREGDARILNVAISIPAEHYLYAEQVMVTGVGADLALMQAPDSKRTYDPFFDAEVDIYDRDVTWRYRVGEGAPSGYTVRVDYQGCNASLCFRPVSVALPVGAAVVTSETSPPGDVQDAAAAVGFTIRGTASGYMSPSEFMTFLEQPVTPEAAADTASWLRILFILLGGLALNLTPCVLPMIPVNIAIIGAGAQAGSRSRGALLGGVYGLGIALAYGTLGLVVVLTGSRFGALNTSSVFNIVVAVVFGVLALAMFGAFSLDFSRFQGNTAGSTRGSLTTAFAFGALAALLAGACVAPVLISVLLWSTSLYQNGVFAGLLLPFLLGVGMAAPWPFAGAGLSFLPKPGKWMDRVKYVFGLLIVVLAVGYFHKGYVILRNRNVHRPSLQELTELANTPDAKPLLLDVVTSTCSSCKKMDRTTFKDETVKATLACDYRFLKYNADAGNDPAVREVLDALEVQGFPTYVILGPRS